MLREPPTSSLKNQIIYSLQNVKAETQQTHVKQWNIKKNKLKLLLPFNVFWNSIPWKSYRTCFTLCFMSLWFYGNSNLWKTSNHHNNTENKLPLIQFKSLPLRILLEFEFDWWKEGNGELTVRQEENIIIFLKLNLLYSNFLSIKI